jgi:tripartite-type tricarboxylate transporter receptor subunit TctC
MGELQRKRRRWARRPGSSLVLALCLALLACAPSVQAQDAFYKGKSLTLYAGFTPGGGVDAEMRLIAQFFSRHVPGAPNIQPMNMPGAGGILLGNYLYTIAKPDGLTIGMPGRSGFFLAAAVGDASARYEIAKFTWLGSAGANNLMLWVRKGIGVRTLDDLRKRTDPVVVGGLASSSASSVVPAVLAKYEGLPLRVISGYTGLSEANLAMERGEIDAIYTHVGTFRPDRVASGEIIPILQTFPIEPNMPSLDDVKSPRARALNDLLTAPSRLGAPLIGPPGLPRELAATLRDAYVAMASSKEYVEEAHRRGIDIGKPNHGAQLQAFVSRSLGDIPKDVVDEYRGYVGLK